MWVLMQVEFSLPALPIAIERNYPSSYGAHNQASSIAASNLVVVSLLEYMFSKIQNLHQSANQHRWFSGKISRCQSRAVISLG
jgi:hypothetical protein